MRVNGIHKTPNKMSETAKFNKNTLVIVRIRLFCTSVKMTSALPVTANNKIVVYSGIWIRPIDSHDGAKFGCCECCCSSVVGVCWYDRCCWWYSSNVAFTLSITFSVVMLNVIISEFLSHFQRDEYVTEGWFTKEVQPRCFSIIPQISLDFLKFGCEIFCGWHRGLTAPLWSIIGVYRKHLWKGTKQTIYIYSQHRNIFFLVTGFWLNFRKPNIKTPNRFCVNITYNSA